MTLILAQNKVLRWKHVKAIVLPISVVAHELLRGQAELLRILSQVAKMTLKIKGNDFHFQYHPRVSQDACLI